MIVHNYIRGTAFMWAGIVLLFLVAGTIILRAGLGCLGLYLVYYGLNLRRVPPMHNAIFIVLGALLFLWAAGSSVVSIGLSIIALYVINYGLRLRGMPSLHVFVYRWVDETQF